MKRTVVLFATLAVVVALVATPVAGAAIAGGVAAAQADPAANESAERPAPGARLAGVVSVQAAEVESEVETRAFGRQVSAADSNRTRATVVAERVTALRERAAEIRERRQALDDALANGTISRARYDAEVVALAARSNALGHQLNQTEAASRGLDAELAERGVDASAIRTLRTEARNLTGPESAELARSIAGDDVGGGLDGRQARAVGRPTGGPPGQGDGGPNITLRTPGPSETNDPRTGNRTVTTTRGLPESPEPPEPGDDDRRTPPSTDDDVLG